MNLEKVISEAGYMVITATSGKDAVAKAKAEKPDAIFMDVIMEDTDGFQAGRELSADPATKAIPVVFVTSKNQKADRMWAPNAGCEGLCN